MSWPKLSREITYRNGLAAIALFAVLAVIFATAGFDAAAGFDADLSITAGIGYALFDMPAQSPLVTEGFLVSFLVIAVVLDAALDGALLLARREEEGRIVTILTDGGSREDED